MGQPSLDHHLFILGDSPKMTSHQSLDCRVQHWSLSMDRRKEPEPLGNNMSLIAEPRLSKVIDKSAQTLTHIPIY